VKTHYPYLSTQCFSEFRAVEYKAYVESLLVRKPVAEVVEITARLSPKGAIVLTTKRKPKWILRSEVERLAAELSRPVNDVWNYAKKKDYAILNLREEAAALEEP
jgi:hypothetical protein